MNLLNLNTAPKQAFARRKTAVKARRACQVRHRLGYPTGRLATSTTASETATYTYNALGQRMKKRNQNGVQTVFHYGPNGELLYERDQAGNTREYVWLDQRPLARIDNGTAIYYYHVDHLGTPQAMTDAAGAVKWRADYEPFGKATVKVSTVENNLRLPGQYFDRETGLHYNYFRDFDPTTGRYVEADPIGLVGGINLYAYVEGNPVSYVDPDGLRLRGGGNPRSAGGRGGWNGGQYYPSIGPSTRQIARSDGSLPSGPPSMSQDAAYRDLFRDMGNFPNPAKQLPQGAWPGVNFPWDPPELPQSPMSKPWDGPRQCK